MTQEDSTTVSKCTYISMYTHVYVHVCAYISMYTHVYMYVRISACTHMYTCMYIYQHVHMCMHVQTHDEYSPELESHWLLKSLCYMEHVTLGSHQFS